MGRGSQSGAGHQGFVVEEGGGGAVGYDGAVSHDDGAGAGLAHEVEVVAGDDDGVVEVADLLDEETACVGVEVT